MESVNSDTKPQKYSVGERTRPARKILIFTASFGDGHDVAAQNIRDALESVSAQESAVEVQIIDLYARCNNFAYQVERKAYLKLINSTPALWNLFYKFSDATNCVEYSLFARRSLRRAMAETLEQEQPDAVVTTYWMYNYLFGSLYKKSAQKRSFCWIGIVPEIETIHSTYWRGGSDVFVVADETSAGVLQRGGVAPGKIKTIGYPVSPRFAALTNQRAPLSSSGRARVLYVINSGKKQAAAIVRQLLRCEQIELTIVVGRDGKLRGKIEAAVQGAPIPVRVFGWRNDIPELLAQSHLFISKCGGSSSQAALAAQCPFLISQVVPGQEEGIARFIVKNNCGAIAENPQQIAAMVEQIFANNGALWREWHTNISRLSRPDATFEIARFVLDSLPPLTD